MDNMTNNASAGRSVIAKGMVFTTGAMMLNNFVNMAAAFVTFNIITARELGKVSLALSVFVISSYFMEFGLGRLFSSEIAKKRALGETGKVRYYVGLLFKIQALSGIALFIILGAAYKPIAALITIPPHFMFAVMIYFVLFSARVFYIMIFNSHLLYLWQNMLDVIMCLVRFLLLVYALFAHPENPILFILYTYPLSALASLVVCTPALIGYVLWPLRGVHTESDTETRAALWKQAKFGIFYNPLKSLVDGAPLWLLRFFADLTAVGIFHCVMQLVRASYSFVRATETTLQPLISQYQDESPEKRQLFMNRISKYSMWLVTLAVLVLWPSIPWLLKFVKPDYMAAVPYFRVCILSIFAMVFMQVQRPLLIAIERMDALIYTNIIQFAVIMSLGALLIHFFGLWGVIVIDVLDKYVSVFCFHIFIKRKEPKYLLITNPLRFDQSDKRNILYLLSFGRIRG